MSTRLAKRSGPMFLAATLDVGYSTFGLGCYLQFNPKKVPPPTPDGREGRLFPPEQSWKTLTLVNELTVGGNKFLPELIRSGMGIAKEMSSFRAHRLNLSPSCHQTQRGSCAFSLVGF